MTDAPACGLQGLREQIDPRAAIDGQAYGLPHALPRGLLEGIEYFDEYPAIKGILGREFCELYNSVKRLEVEEFMRVISPWEREHLLLNV